jgi:hypothetical protein
MGKSKPRDISRIHAVPVSLECPLCAAAPGEPCKSTGDLDRPRVPGSRFRIVHLARIRKAAGAVDSSGRRL